MNKFVSLPPLLNDLIFTHLYRFFYIYSFISLSLYFYLSLFLCMSISGVLLQQILFAGLGTPCDLTVSSPIPCSLRCITLTFVD